VSAEIEKRLRLVEREIAQAAQLVGRRSDSIQLIAVSKTFSAERIAAAFQAGQRVFAESYVQEAREKYNALPELLGAEAFASGAFTAGTFHYHFVGGLQRNKVKHAVGMFDLIHSVDRLELAQEISKVAERRSICQRILLQVNVSGEANKAGVELDACDQSRIISFCQELLALPAVKLEGLMAIGSQYPLSAEQSLADLRSAEFRKLRCLRDLLEKECQCCLPELSMGMSTDFSFAIAEGATMVRLGTAVFGPR